jgi:DNA segregation ATPase FtsK/SpoIIIE-like protein
MVATIVDRRPAHLEAWAQTLWRAAQTAGALGGKKPIQIHAIDMVCGPRAGALEILAGLDAGRLLDVLRKNDCALHRQFVPWPFIGQPSVFMSGRYVRLEAGWPDAMAEKDIKLSDIGQNPKEGGRWIAGKNEMGKTITLSLSNTVPHYLLGGYTGSGKTYAMRSAVAQLARDPRNRLVLIDGKWGYGLGPLANVTNRVGPLAIEFEQVRGALSWSIGEMRKRYRTGISDGRLIIVIDEVQEFTKDSAVAEMLRRLAAQGRDKDIHLVIGTQDPTADAFKEVTTRRNLVGRIALHTENYKASEVVVGGPTPRADWLLGAGDAYALTPEALHRVQLAYIPESALANEATGEAEFDEWPEYDPEAAGTLPENTNGGRPISGEEMAISLVQAHLGAGRPTLQRALENAGLDKPGSSRADWLLSLGRDAYQWLIENDWMLCES